MLAVSRAADFCVGYFHLRGWRKIGDLIERFQAGDRAQARILVGMMRTPQDDLHDDLRLSPSEILDQRKIKHEETKLVEAFKEQLTFGMPDNATIFGLRQLAKQLRQRKVCVKLFLKHPLHAKLYLTYN